MLTYGKIKGLRTFLSFSFGAPGHEIPRETVIDLPARSFDFAKGRLFTSLEERLRSG